MAAIGILYLQRHEQAFSESAEFEPFTVCIRPRVRRIAIEHGICTQEQWDAEEIRGRLAKLEVTLTWVSPNLVFFRGDGRFSRTMEFEYRLIESSSVNEFDYVNWAFTFDWKDKQFVLYVTTKESRAQSDSVDGHVLREEQTRVPLAVVPGCLLLSSVELDEKQLSRTHWGLHARGPWRHSFFETNYPFWGACVELDLRGNDAS